MRQYLRDEQGAALVYISIILVALVGLTGLAIDAGRMFTLREEVQQAADAAALAGAYQLDGTAAGAALADSAARTAPVVTNAHKFGQTPGAVSIASTSFWESIPSDDDLPLSSPAPDYNYIEVTTQAVTHQNLFLQAIGIAPTANLTATAVARRGEAVCQVTPLAICNPNEDPALGGVGAAFDPSVWMGRQIRIRQHGAGAQWAPGEFGLLDTPYNSQSTKAVAESIAEGNGNACFSNDVSTKPGQANAANNAFNTRFDVYENPFFGGNAKNDPRFPPAENVTKGFDTSGPVNAYCNNPAQALPGEAATLSRDSNLSPTNRFGNGSWDCLAYWNVAHGPNSGAPAPPPASCSTPAAAGFTRFDLYRYEIANGLIPTPGPTAATPKYVEEGVPACYNGTVPPTPTTPGTLQTDRRILTFAVMNCLEHNIRGNETNVPVEAYLNGFMTEPVITGPNEELYLEVVGSSDPGNGGIVPVVMRDWVELVR